MAEALALRKNVCKAILSSADAKVSKIKATLMSPLFVAHYPKGLQIIGPLDKMNGGRQLDQPFRMQFPRYQEAPRHCLVPISVSGE